MADYSAALRDWDNASSEDYREWPNDTMSLETLRANKDFLVARLYYWNDIYWQSGSTAKSNISKLDAKLRTKLSAYEAAIVKKMEAMLDQANVAASGGGTWVDPSPTTVGTGTTTINPADTINSPVGTGSTANPVITAQPNSQTSNTTTVKTNPVVNAVQSVATSAKSNKKTWLIVAGVSVLLIATAVIIRKKMK